MEQLNSLDLLSIREKKKYPGAPETWKLRPVCCLSDASDAEVYYAVSEGGAFPDLAAFRKAHTCTIYLIDGRGEQVLYFSRRHTALFGPKMEIFDASGDFLGMVQRHGTARMEFQVVSVSGEILYSIEGSSADPEVFHVRQGAVTVGKISRRPGRTAEKEVSGNAHFGIVFPFSADETEKNILIGALFLIDLTF